ncbi:AraC family transcriptional regulator [uncultured Desulfobacter sp.]|uniref:helix-turn-helix domain-containing protein n=1 Tax=uncultured Desulfobacter sp. TaxID=240139 RepID=UPI0029F4927A|nr:AraC family transcriptional regulator [uncultured Desulfobacter sp.]
MNLNTCSDIEAGIEQERSLIQTRTLFDNNCSLDDMRNHCSYSEAHRKWPSEIGIGHVTMIQLRPGLLLGIGNYRLKEYIEFSFEYTEANAPLFFGYVQSGSVTFTLQSEKDHQSISNKPGNMLIGYLPGERCVCRPPVGVSVSTIGIGIDPWLLKTWVGEEYLQAPAGLRSVLDGAQRPYSELSPSPPEINVILNQIITCPYRGALKRLYLEAKALELILPKMAPLNSPAPKNAVSFDKRDADLIRETELLLRNNLENPPSLPELARRAGVNKNKLNQGFRKIFGTSVFEHIRILRLERARDLLVNGNKSVTEVAYEVGYTHPENFTRAFKRHFCTSPKDHLL